MGRPRAAKKALTGRTATGTVVWHLPAAGVCLLLTVLAFTTFFSAPAPSSSSALSKKPSATTAVSDEQARTTAEEDEEDFLKAVAETCVCIPFYVLLV